jgi:hypothetical protein
MRASGKTHVGHVASSPLSAASTPSLRTAVMRTLIEIEPNPASPSATRDAALTVAFAEPGPGLPPEPLEKLIQPEIVDPPGDRGRAAVSGLGHSAGTNLRLFLQVPVRSSWPC